MTPAVEAPHSTDGAEGRPPAVPLVDATDHELLLAHSAGDPDAFGEVFRRHKDRMWAVAVRTCGDREMAADAVQDGVLAAFRRADSFRGDAAVTTWLHRIVVNACIDRLRRQRPTSPLPEGDVLGDRAHTGTRAGTGTRDGGPVAGRDEPASTEVALDVRGALARLPEGQRLALVLVDLHDLSVAEAAQVLGVAEGTVTSRCARGRTALAELLGIQRPPRNPGDPQPV